MPVNDQAGYRTMTRFQQVAVLKDLVPGKGLKIRAGGKNIVLLRHKGSVVAFANECPHQFADLSDGYIKEDKLYCSMHHWSFNLPDGALTFNNELKLHSYAVKIEDDKVLVAI